MGVSALAVGWPTGIAIVSVVPTGAVLRVGAEGSVTAVDAVTAVAGAAWVPDGATAVVADAAAATTGFAGSA
jgi:hypothetical protein